jgi:hypothetical protein
MIFRKDVNAFIVICFSILLVQSSEAQELPENATLADINSLREDISNRMNTIANSETEISEERRWLSQVKVSVRQLKNSYLQITENVDVDKFKNELATLVDKLSTINCTKISECKSQVENVVNDYKILSQDENIVDAFDYSKNWAKVDSRFRRLFLYFPSSSRSTPIPFDRGECTRVKNEFSNPEVKKDIGNFTDVRKQELANFYKDRSDKLTAINSVEQQIDSYSKKLNEAWDKANTKMSLQTNLYLMILIIGALSVATIGIIRWFPEVVMREWVESGQVIQFVTVMILLSVIMSLGLAGLLGENTLGTLLGGIGGYVLSQGVGRSAARAAIKDIKAGTGGSPQPGVGGSLPSGTGGTPP